MKTFSAKKSIIGIIFFILLITASPVRIHTQAQEIRPSLVPKALLPEDLMDILIWEISGEIQLNNIRLLGSFDRIRTAEEYEKIFYESEIILEKLEEYGIDEYGVEDVPIVLISDLTWAAESAELWMLQPEKRKLATLEDTPACLCLQSQTSDVEAELVYAGPGNAEKFYRGLDVADKIVLVSGRPYEAHDLAVGRYGALGIISYSTTHPEFDPDAVMWDSISRGHDPAKDGTEELSFGFMVSPRMGEELRRMLERGEKVVIKAKCRTRYYPSRNELVWALIKGIEKPHEELVMTAHLFEMEKTKQGANDNMSGCASLLETARVIQKLIRDGVIPRPRRSIRFLWIDEHAGTLGYIQKHPQLMKRFFANINEDMVGEALIKNRASFYLKTTPYSLPTYLNDVLANFIEYVGENNRNTIIHRPAGFLKPILSLSGTKDPFYYQIGKFYGASDHDIFVDGGIGIPAVSFIVWPDIWYHTNKDRPEKSDSTQLKRVSVIDTAAALLLADAGAGEAIHIAGEVRARGKIRIAEEEKRAYSLIAQSVADNICENYKEAENSVRQAYAREQKAIRTVSFFDPHSDGLSTYLETLAANLEKRKERALLDLYGHYEAVCGHLGIETKTPELSSEEKRLSRVFPHRTEKMKGFFLRREFHKRIEDIDHPKYNLRRYEDLEIRNFIDGRLSILEIRNAVSPQFRPIPLRDVENYILTLEMDGMVTIEHRSASHDSYR